MLMKFASFAGVAALALMSTALTSPAEARNGYYACGDSYCYDDQNEETRELNLQQLDHPGGGVDAVPGHHRHHHHHHHHHADRYGDDRYGGDNDRYGDDDRNGDDRDDGPRYHDRDDNDDYGRGDRYDDDRDRDDDDDDDRR